MRFIIVVLSVFINCAVYAESMLYPLDAKPLAFSGLQGKWVFINYWASWCEPCLEEIPELNQFYASNKNKVVLYAVNYDMLSVEMQKRLISHYHIQYPALIKDPAGDLNLGDIRGIPVTFVFNPHGELVTTLYGGQKAAYLRQLIVNTP